MGYRLVLGIMPLVTCALACGFSGESDEPPPPQAPTPVAPNVAPPGAPNIVERTSAGNLEPSRPPLGCLAAAQLDSTMTPVDLYSSMNACARADRPEDAGLLFALAGVYARFDSLRVADRSAHQAGAVLLMRYRDSVPPAQWEPVVLTAQREETERCATIRRIGPPAYHPTYMIQHGMGAFTGGGGDPLVADFDRDDGWERALDSYLHCPPVE